MLSTMAKNKRDIDRQSKADHLVGVAADLFMRQGYEGTTMAEIARAAEIAPNTIYWYFEDKDAILLAALERLVAQGLQAHEALVAGSVREQLEWILLRFEVAADLVATVHARIALSEPLRAWHAAFHERMDALLAALWCRHGAAPEQAKTLSMAATFLVEGLLVHPHDASQRAHLLDWLAAQVDQASVRPEHAALAGARQGA